jgi:hypothetical protein
MLDAMLKGPVSTSYLIVMRKEVWSRFRFLRTSIIRGNKRYKRVSRRVGLLVEC